MTLVDWESEMMDRLGKMCDAIIHRGEEGLLATAAVRTRLGKVEGETHGQEYEYGVECIRQLWQEEVEVAKATRENIDRGVSFW